MSVEERLRVALQDQAMTVQPDVETALAGVHARGGAVRSRRTVLAGAGVAASVAAVVGAVVWAGPFGREAGPPAGDPTRSVVPTERPTGAVALRGVMEGVVTDPPEFAGAWSLRLNGNATLDVVAPQDYTGVVAGALYTADRSSFRTTLFQSDVCAAAGTGIYTWLAFGDRVEFTVVSDPCGARGRFFEESVWTVSTEQGPRG
jgi:hypothetical protein